MIAGIDVSTKQVAIVMLDDDHDRAYPYTFPLTAESGDRPAWAAARSVQDVLPRPTGLFWDPVWLIGIEDPYTVSRGTAKAYGLIIGAVLTMLPRDVPVLPLPSTEWKRETCGKPKADKDEVAVWVFRTWKRDEAITVVDRDEVDAYAIAYAARAVNARAVETTSRRGAEA